MPGSTAIRGTRKSSWRVMDRNIAFLGLPMYWKKFETTIWNPKFIQGLQKEGAKGAADLVEPVRNMQAWNYIQPGTIDETLWDETYRVYIEDKHGLNMKAYFEEKASGLDVNHVGNDPQGHVEAVRRCRAKSG